MSFIYNNPWLVNQLLQAAIESENKLSKKAQPLPVNQQQLAENMRALLNHLRDEITPLQEGKDQVGHASGGAELSSHNMDSMGDLVEWMSKNGTRIGNQVIVIDGKGERPSEDYGYFKIEPGTEIVVPLAKPDRNVRAFWINPTALKNYLVSLQSDPKLKGNVIFQVQLLKLIQDANNQLDLDLSEQYKEPETQIDDGKEVDRFPKIVEKFSNFAQAGDTPLYYKDIKSLESLNAWLGTNQIGHKTEDNKTVTIRDQDFDLCGIINYMYGRATLLYQRRTAESGPIMKAYIGKMTEIAKQAGCELSQPGKGQPGKEQPGQGGQISQQIAQQLVTLLPFNSQNVNFREIKKFVDTYAKFQPNRSDIVGMAQQINDSINKSQGVMQQPSMIVPLQQMKSTNDLSSYHAFAKDNQLADYLYSIVNSAGIMYTDFVNTISNVLGRDATLENRQQIAPGGPWSVNMDDINQFRTDLAQEGKYGPRKVYL